MTSLFDYLLNAFEEASQSPMPASMGYADKRRALLEYVRKLETSAPSSARAPKELEELELIRSVLYGFPASLARNDALRAVHALLDATSLESATRTTTAPGGCGVCSGQPNECRGTVPNCPYRAPTPMPVSRYRAQGAGMGFNGVDMKADADGAWVAYGDYEALEKLYLQHAANDTARLDWMQRGFEYTANGGPSHEASISTSDAMDALETHLLESEGDLRKAIDAAMRGVADSESTLPGGTRDSSSEGSK